MYSSDDAAVEVSVAGGQTNQVTGGTRQRG